MLDPDVVVRADGAAVEAGAAAVVRGAAAVAGTFSGRATAAQPAVIDGDVGLVWAPGGRPKVVFRLAIDGDRISEIEMVADPDSIGEFDLEILEG